MEALKVLGLTAMAYFSRGLYKSELRLIVG